MKPSCTYYRIGPHLHVALHRLRGDVADFFKDSRLQLCAFSCPAPGADAPIDLDVTIGPFTPSLHDCLLIDRRFHIREDFLFFCEPLYQVAISGMNQSRMRVQIAPQTSALRALHSPNTAWADQIIRPLLELLLAHHDLAMIHAAGYADAQGATILAGRGGSRKTSVAMQAARSGSRLLGDDMVLIDRAGMVHPLPLYLPILSYRIARKPEEELSLFDKIRIQASFRHNPHRSQPSVAPASALRRWIGLLPTHDDDCRLSPCSPAQAGDFLLTNNQLEMMYGPFYWALQAYALVFPTSPCAEHFPRLRAILSTALAQRQGALLHANSRCPATRLLQAINSETPQ